MIDKVIGSAPFAVATVLSVFMGGLALGSWAVGRYISHLSSKNALLALYGKLELAIGVYALLLPLLIKTATPIYAFAYHYLMDFFWIYQFFAFAGAVILLIVPACLMGGTMPVLCQFYISRIDHLGTRTGQLYGLNTTGAAFGALLCGFVLISSLGVQKTLYVAAGINFFVGVLCILVSRQKETLISKTPPFNHTEKRSNRKSRKLVSESSKMPGKATTWALGLFAVSGFCSMAYQVFWTKLITLLIGPTTYSFTLVVATFIIGLSAGSLIFGWIGDKIKRDFLLLVLTQICASGSALAVSQFLGNSQFLFSKLIFSFQDKFGTMILAQSMVLFAILIIPTVFLGAAFPLVSRIYARSMSVLGKSIGKAYAVNTVGAILGSFTAGFILIPFMGKENGLKLVILFQFLTAILAFVHVKYAGFRTPGSRKYQRISALSMAIAASLLISYYPCWNRNILSRGWYRNFQDIEHELKRMSWIEAVRLGSDLLAKKQTNLDVVFYGDGIGGFSDWPETVSMKMVSLPSGSNLMKSIGIP